MPRLTVAMCISNERDRFLRSVLQAVRMWADCLVILDDGSTDGSDEIARAYADVFERNDTPLFHEEWRLRSKLFDMAVATNPDYIGVLDADEWFEPCIADELDAAMSSGAKVLGYKRYDMWGDLDHYRSDEFWNAHERLTVFAVRYDPALPQVWPRKNQHVGNFPDHWNLRTPVYALRARMAHLGWVRPEDQRSKYDRYRRLDPTPDRFGAVQYASILDPRPRLLPWEGAPVFSESHPRPVVTLRQSLLTIGSPIRQNPKVLAAFLRGVEELDPCGHRVRYAFIDDCTDAAASKVLMDWMERREGGEIHQRPGDFIRATDAEAPNTYARAEHHNWSTSTTTRLGLMRNVILRSAMESGSDHLLLVDSDIVLRPDTLRWLLAAGKPIVSEVMWTRYFPYQKHRHPNCWAWGDSNFWPGFAGETVEPLETYERWRAWYRMLQRPGVYEVGGLGACTLMQRGALSDIYLHGGYGWLPRSGSYGEDRWFCLRAQVLGHGLWVDSHAEPLHLYRDEDLRRLAGWRRRHARERVSA